MSRSVNKVILIGNAGGNPEVRTTGSGTRVATLSIATNRRWTDARGQQQEETEWHRLTFWAKLAEVVERYVRTGDRLYVEGRMHYGEYERQGQKVPTAEVVVQEMVMLGGDGPREAPQAEPAFAPQATFQPDDDLPF